MTDSEYGRAWADQVGVAPKQLRTPRGRPEVSWFVDGMPRVVVNELRRMVFASKRSAFAELGRTVRRIQAAVPRLED